MATTTWKSTSDTNYLNAADYDNGAPVAGSIVVIPESQAVPVATNVAISNEQINLTGTTSKGQFNASGTTTLDALTTINGTPMNGNAVRLNDSTVNNGTITDATLIIGGSLSVNSTVTNNGTITYNTAASANGGNYIDGSSVATVTFANNGIFNVLSQAGATNTGPANGPTPPIPTTVEFSSLFAGTGVVNIIGGFPNSAAPKPFVSGAPEQAFLQFDFGAVVTGNTFNLNDGYVTFSSPDTGSTFNFLDARGVVRFAGGTNIGTGITITGFRAGDLLDIGTAVNAAGLSYNTTTNILSYTDTSNAAHSFTIIPTGGQTYTTASFVVNNNGTNGITEPTITTTAAAPCYCPGTLILTDHGEVAVEDLAIGDRVETINGSQAIVWIGKRAFDGRFIESRRDVLPVCIRAGALDGDAPRRDLWVSPLHAMFIDDVLVPAQALVNGVSIIQAETVEHVEYIHIELARHDVIWAEGALSETFVDDRSREMFHNAAEFAALYPGRPRIDAAYCAPRVADGEALDRIRRALDLRAGCVVAGSAEPMDGSVDSVAGSVVRGWAVNPDQPHVPVCLEVVVDGRVAGRVVASQFRDDGRGVGCHGFSVDLPAIATGRHVQVQRASDGAVLSAPVKRAA